MNIDKAEEAYRNDDSFRRLVDMMIDSIHNMNYTASELRSAAMLAAIKFEQMRPCRPVKWRTENHEYDHNQNT